MLTRSLTALTAALGLLALGRAEGRADEAVDYTRQIKPLLAEKCVGCHGGLERKGNLRLDTAKFALKGGKRGPAVVPGDAKKSLLMVRVTAEEGSRMPPEGEPLTAEQVALLRRWIDQKAPAPADEVAETDARDHRAFRALVRPKIPEFENAAWPRNPIDSFVARQHEKHGLAPQREADRELLVRRLYLDLVGMPPSPEEAARIDQDREDHWYESLVDRLLADPRHGERWGRHWMDIWRYSDWWGLGNELRNSHKHIWHWRDWIIESVNSDVGYDEMVRQMLAADELYPSDLAKLRATGFLARNHFLFNRDQWMDETVEHVSKAFLGLTMNCAKCHDHKFDPLSQADYYRLRAFFEPYEVRTDMVPGEVDLSVDGIPRVFDARPDAPTYLYVRGDEKKPDKSSVVVPGIPSFLNFRKIDIRPVELPAESWQPERRPWVLEAHGTAAQKRVVAAQAALEGARKQHPRKAEGEKQDVDEVAIAELALAVAEADLKSVTSRAAASRAAWARRDERAKADEAVESERLLEVAKARHRVGEVRLRLARVPGPAKGALEKELTQATDALARAEKSAAGPVTGTDRFTPFEGARWSVTRFRSSTADDPRPAFQPKSTGRRKALAEWITDPRHPLTARVAVNHLWTRHFGSGLVGTVFDFGRNGAAPANPELLDWLAAELIQSGWSMKHVHRLIVTSSAYRMSSSKLGRKDESARDPDNVHFWRRSPIRLESQVIRDSILQLAGILDLARGGPPVPAQAESSRRSVYLFHSKNERHVFLNTFDDADVKECYRRDVSIVPQQALALANSALVLDASKLVAERLSADRPDDEAFVRRAFRSVLGTSPSDAEVAASVKALARWREQPDGTAARANLVWVLFNHNDFVTLR